MSNPVRKHNGIAVALAWPQTYCKQPGTWYDAITLMLGINENNYYRVGHAAVLLFKQGASKIHYFDFGRYHAPYKHGRVRSAETDHDLQLLSKPVFDSAGNLQNLGDILTELQNNRACHGEGDLHAAHCEVNFDLAFQKAKEMQNSGPIAYGPFIRKGSNCSRFVNTVIKSGGPAFKYHFRLNYFMPFTPTPRSNVKALEEHTIIRHKSKTGLFRPLQPLKRKDLESTLPAPEKPVAIPGEAKWLAGEGSGSWFVMKFDEKGMLASRYSPEGALECQSRYVSTSSFDGILEQENFEIAYPSDCKRITLRISNALIQFERTA